MIVKVSVYQEKAKRQKKGAHLILYPFHLQLLASLACYRIFSSSHLSMTLWPYVHLHTSQ